MLDDLLQILSEAPDGQIDRTITIRLKGLIGKEPSVVVKELKQILYECAYASLASDFAMMTMDAVYRMAKYEKDLCN